MRRPSLYQRRAAPTLFALSAFLIPFLSITLTRHAPRRLVVSTAGIVELARPTTAQISRDYDRFDVSTVETTTTSPRPVTMITSPAPARRVMSPAVTPGRTGAGGAWCKGSVSMTAHVEAWRPHVIAAPDGTAYRWPVADFMRFMCVESGGDPTDRNPRSSATGLFGILGGSTDGYTNIAEAYSMWQQRGEEPWLCCE